MYKDYQIYECFHKTVDRFPHLTHEEILKVLESFQPAWNLRAIIQNSSRKLVELSGVRHFSYFNDILGKKILLLGEYHSDKGICSNTIESKVSFEIQNWLIDIAKSAPRGECIDIFTESPYKATDDWDWTTRLITTEPIKLKNFDSPLSAVLAKFKFEQNRDTFPDNLRHHNIDSRLVHFPHPIVIIDNIGRTKNQQINLTRLDLKYKEEKREILAFLLSMNYEGRRLFHKYLENVFNIMGAEYSALDTEKYLLMYFRTISKEINKMDPSIDRSLFLKTLLDVYIETFDIYTSLLNIPIDVYFLSRIFINFTNSRGYCKDQPIKYVICHTGSNHTKVYKLFIEKYFSTNTTLHVKQKNQCIILDQPFDFYN